MTIECDTCGEIIIKESDKDQRLIGYEAFMLEVKRQLFIYNGMIINGTCGSCKTIGKIHSDTKLCLTCDKRGL